MSRLLSLWKSDDLALAIDPTMLDDRLCAIVVSAVYRGCAIPVARVVKPGSKPGEWMESTAELLDPLVGCDSLEYAGARDDGPRTEKPKAVEKDNPAQMASAHAPARRHHILHRKRDADAPARKPVSGPGNAFVARGTAFRAESIRTKGTIIVIWVEGQNEPWILLTDIAPSEAGASWRSLRFWIETGFKALKSVGLQWQKTQRTIPARVERHWLVLASATLMTLAYGARVEDAQAQKKSPGALRSPPKVAPERSRITSVFRLGMAILSRLLAKGRLWRRVWLLPEPWPQPPEGVKAVLHPEN